MAVPGVNIPEVQVFLDECAAQDWSIEDPIYQAFLLMWKFDGDLELAKKYARRLSKLQKDVAPFWLSVLQEMMQRPDQLKKAFDHLPGRLDKDPLHS